MIKPGQVFRRGNDGNYEVGAVGGFADGEELDAIGVLRGSLEVSLRIVVTGQIKIVARIPPQDGDRGRDGSDHLRCEHKEEEDGAHPAYSHRAPIGPGVVTSIKKALPLTALRPGVRVWAWQRLRDGHGVHLGQFSSRFNEIRG